MALVRVVRGAAVLWRLRAVFHAVVPDDAGNTQPVIIENPGTPPGLGLAMLGNIPPCRDRLFVTEERQRQNLAFLGQALEPFDRDKAVDGFQDRPQFSREIEIFASMLRLGPDFEDHSYHLHLLRVFSIYRVTCRRNVRSSARRKTSPAKALTLLAKLF